MIKTYYFLLLLLYSSRRIESYQIQGRFGHTAVKVNDSIYFYGGDSSVASQKNVSEWISELSILPIYSSYSLTDPPWKPASGPQNTIGGPSVYSHVAFLGGPNQNSMIVVGGVMPPTNTDLLFDDEEPTAFSYNYELGRWNSFSLPGSNHLNRQGAACTLSKNGIAYIWGGKRAMTPTYPPPSSLTSSLHPSQKQQQLTPIINNSSGTFSNNSNVTLSTTSKSVLPANMYRFDSINPANSSSVLTRGALVPPLRYAHTQTLIGDDIIVVLGGFDGASGEAVSLADVWVFSIKTSSWNQINATLDKEGKPANRSGHSQVLMPDGVSILVYGGYDGYHVYNDVAVLDTRTWTWTVKNTNAVVQGRADHTATLASNNMIVAFGFTGVSTTLTVMSDVEVLDIITWSWTSVYTPGRSIVGSNNNNGSTNKEISNEEDWIGNNTPSSPSIAIIAGAITGGLVVFILILIALYMLNRYHKRLKENSSSNNGSNDDREKEHSLYSLALPASSVLNMPRAISSASLSHQQSHKNHSYRHSSNRRLTFEVMFDGPLSPNEPFEYYEDTRRPSMQTHPLQKNRHARKHTDLKINTKDLPLAKPDGLYSGTSATLTSLCSSPVTHVPSPWSPFRPLVSHNNDDWVIRRVASTPGHYTAIQSIAAVSKPDDVSYPMSSSSGFGVKRAATISESVNMISDSQQRHSNGNQSNSNSSSTVTLTAATMHLFTQKNKEKQDKKMAAATHDMVKVKDDDSASLATTVNSTFSNPTSTTTKTINLDSNATPAKIDEEDGDDDSSFDRQEFILQADEVAENKHNGSQSY